MTRFHDLGLPAALLSALDKIGFETATPIQAGAIPPALKGQDVLGTAATGTGKTAAFALPMLAHLLNNPNSKAIVLTPTRELAMQVLSTIKPFIFPAVAKDGIRAACLIGGEAYVKQMSQLKHKPRLIVATPGRMNDHLKQKTLVIDTADFLVLDETDRMLDMGFGVQIESIIKLMVEQRQTLMFSATLPPTIMKMANRYLKSPVRITVGEVNKPTAAVKQETIETTETEKYAELLEQLDKRTGSVIIFVKTKHGADRLAEKLQRAEHAAEAIHGDLSQRRRSRVIDDFRKMTYRILVATDVAARGLDIPHIEHVINYDLPQAPEDYVHRIGRTARAGAEGHALNLLTSADRMKWRAIVRLIDPDAKVEKEPRHMREAQRRERPKSFGERRPFGMKNRSEEGSERRPRPERSYERSTERSSERSYERKSAPSHENDNARGAVAGASRARRENSDAWTPLPMRREYSGDAPMRRERSGDAPMRRERSGDAPMRRERSGDAPMRRERSGDAPMRRERSGDAPMRRERSGDAPMRRERSGDGAERAGGKSFAKPFAKKSFSGKPAAGGSKPSSRPSMGRSSAARGPVRKKA